jgi:hypothetical protein
MLLREAKDDPPRGTTRPGGDAPKLGSPPEPSSAVPSAFLLHTLALLSSIAAWIHASAFHHHVDRPWMIPIFFVTVALAQGRWAFLVWRRPTRTLLAWGIGLNTVVALVWIASRTTGAPIVAGAPEPVGLVDALAMMAEVTIVIGSVVLLRPRGAPAVPDPSGLPGFLTIREAAILSHRPLEALLLLRGEGSLPTRALIRGVDEPASTFVATEALRRVGLLEPLPASREDRWVRGEQGRARGRTAIVERLLLATTAGALVMAPLALVGLGPDLATHTGHSHAASESTATAADPDVDPAAPVTADPAELPVPILRPARSPLEFGADLGPDCTTIAVPGEITACGTEEMGGGPTTWVVERTDQACCVVRIFTSPDGGGWVETMRGKVLGIDIADVTFRAIDLTGDQHPELVAGFSFSEPGPSLAYEIVLHEPGSHPRVGLHSWGQGGAVTFGDGVVEQYLAQYPIAEGCCEGQSVVNELRTYRPAPGHAGDSGSAHATRDEVDRSISQFAPNDDRCCPFSFLRLVIRWNGSSFGWSEAAQVDPSVVPASDL